ncbi:MAG: flotillin family protein [Microcoleus sp. PH2017_10_PVI_O_A]|uniref:SPFH domain-containing protein n=1 Tax=unclassified Microcoleus TaxID=2642155 RepID=UPI001D2F54A2|nr:MULTISPECIES: SPFH domain-containing protein [unclassified Microcoleus]TAE84554.1 MAG: flotillin family protein [Oscillatoriales cyanobacterium]MCC3409098.1 flotillin family protein [Microcoleus sp. PH2017_10_PVI_O_A]MCC3463216.1 flotillin family protein [Microcoleus sp. PH2017_11_PCY_U_A]MCC3481637.1 flotillin family protein [Microcoleus sp. PH2017_12_PCY_D_A]MCC3562554.1 flotillin family protein [Microcoleus sp. PH2017_27_LUM_O_A]
MTKSRWLRKLLPLAASFATTIALAGTFAPPTPAQTNPPPPQPQPVQPATEEGFTIPIWIFPVGAMFFVFMFIPKIGWTLGLIAIGEREVGIVTKKFSSKNLPSSRLIALDGEGGLQADTLPPGWHFGYFPWQYSIKKEPVVVVPQDEIGLIIANDGATIPPDRILGTVVDCDNFQNARKFLTNGGEKGRQLAVITTGTYRINTALFEVITSANAKQKGMEPSEFKVYKLAPERVGIVTVLDGVPIDEGEIAGPIIPGHNNFQKAQSFIKGGGRRGLQEQIILSGSWNLNPWFVQVEQVKMTEVPIGYVGVVISFVGESQKDVSGEAFTHGNLVTKGNKGVWIEPLYPGKHPINTKVMKVELVPTTDVVLNFTSRFSGEHGYDSKLSAMKLLSFDGFGFELEIFQIIHVGTLDAPRVISRQGSMQNLIDQVLRPIVGNYFRNSAQEYTILDFLIARSDRQAEAGEHVRQALRAYDVQAVDTLIGVISPPAELMQTLTDRKIAQEQEKTYEAQRNSESQRQELVRATAIANIQHEVVGAEQGVKIAQLTASAAIEHASGEAQGIRLMGEAKADAYQVGVSALGIESYTMLQAIQAIADGSVRVVPDVAVNGSGGGGGLLDGLMATFMRNETTKNADKAGELPVLNGHKSEPVLVESVAELPIAKVNSVSVKSPESLNH